MNTALIASGTASARPTDHETLVERISRRAGLALAAWRRRTEQRRSREYLSELHERRQEAERLRGEALRSVTLARML